MADELYQQAIVLWAVRELGEATFEDIYEKVNGPISFEEELDILEIEEELREHYEEHI